MQIENNILRHYLKDVYFITGTAYAGKSTAAKLLSERFGLILCGENYFSEVSDQAAEPACQPDLCYLRDLQDFRDFVTRTPEEYERWMYNTGREAAGFEVAELIRRAGSGKVIADTNIPLDILHEISDERHVAVMLSPQSLSVDRFFDRADPEKQYILSVIESCADSAKVMENYRQGLARINSKAHYDEYANSGFFTLVRENCETDTREAVCEALARHFGFL